MVVGGAVSPSGERLSSVFSMADVTVEVTAAERAAGEMAPAKVEAVKALFREHGVVAFTAAAGAPPLIPHADLDLMKERLEYQSLLAVSEGRLMENSTNQRGNGGARGFHTGSLPRRSRWVRPSVIANDIIEQAVAACLGVGCWLSTFGTITNHPGSETQDLHMDGTWWKTSAEEAAAVNHPWPYRATMANVSFGCDDVTEATATEFWPGSQWDTKPATTFKPRDPAGHAAAVAAGADRRRAEHPPIQLTIPKGSFCVRDWRCWHRGVANRSAEPRYLLNMAYASKEVRADLTVGSSILRTRATLEEQAAASSDTGWEDDFVRFHPDCRETIDTPSKHGVDRNVQYRSDVIIPAIPRSLQVDAAGNVTERLPFPMPPALTEVAWAERAWRRRRAKL